MSKCLKLLAVFCFNISIVGLNAQSNIGILTHRGSMSLENWAIAQGRFWDEQDWRAGDFDGDGLDDLARVFRDGRNVSIDVYRSNGKTFTMESWTLQQGRFWDEQYWRAGDFDGDGLDDLARVFRDGRNVSIDVYRSNGEAFTMENWTLQQGRFWDEHDWRAGDFDGDGADDLARMFKDGRNVSIDVYRSDSKSFVLEKWSLQQGRFWNEQHWRAGDFNGDGVDDLARAFRDGRNASIDVYCSNKNSFVFENWAMQQGRFWDEQHWFAGDFDNDGVDDIGKAFKDGRNSSIDIYRSDKTSFTSENRVQQQGRFWDDQYWRAGDFNGDGVDDIARAFRDERNVSINVYLRRH